MPHSQARPGKSRDDGKHMPEPEHDPLKELFRYALVAGGMSLIVLVLTRGKWLTGLLIGVWLGFVVLRFRRATKASNRKC